MLGKRGLFSMRYRILNAARDQGAVHATTAKDVLDTLRALEGAGSRVLAVLDIQNGDAAIRLSDLRRRRDERP